MGLAAWLLIPCWAVLALLLRPKLKVSFGFLCVAGSATWKADPKPALNDHAGKSIPDSPYSNVLDPEKFENQRVVVVGDANGQQRNKLYPLQTGYKQYGESGTMVSDWFPHIVSRWMTWPLFARCGPLTTTTGHRSSFIRGDICLIRTNPPSVHGSPTVSVLLTIISLSSSILDPVFSIKGTVIIWALPMMRSTSRSTRKTH